MRSIIGGKSASWTRLAFVVLGVAVTLVAVYAVFSFLSSPSHNVFSSSKNFFLSLTDPATVPAGTTALYVTYSALQLSVSSNGTTTVQTLPGSGTVNVLELQNSSIVLATAHIPNGSKVTQIRVNISNAIITVNGQNSTVVIGESALEMNVTAGNSISGRESGLIDLIPSVTAIETVDKTVYVLTASVRAVITPADVFAGQTSKVGVPQQPPPVGGRLNFSANINVTRLMNSVTPTIKITSASIVVNGNDTDFTITVQNTGNSSVELNGLMINGSKTVYFPPPPASLMFNMPPMNFMLPIMPPGTSLPPGVPSPPTMIIILPNGTVLNTTSFFSAPPSFPPPTNGSSLPSQQPPAVSGAFYILEIKHTAPAISFNSSAVVFNVSEDMVAKMTTPPNFSSVSISSGPNAPPPSIPIPAGSKIINLPVGTKLFISFPPGTKAPSPPPQPTSAEMQGIIIGRMIFPNGSLGFPPISLIMSRGQPGAPQGQPGSIEGQANAGALNALSSGAQNLSISIPANIIPKGYLLAAGSSVTFSLSGLLSLGPAPQLPQNVSAVQMIQPPFAVLIPGDVYSINLFGETGAHAQTHVTAS